MNEKEIETQILHWLNCQPGIFAFKINTTGIYDPTKGVFRTITNKFIHKGCSDILGIILGNFFAMEVKTPKTIRKFFNRPGERELNQQLFLSRVKHFGGHATCVSSLEEAIDFIQTIKTLSSNN